ncbi:MAG: alanine:cation symporter family protein [Prevotellaceae bacterium]|jgi:AGCS family alanine or glycine:cation symporter|nr:alanine:cation symporter family protein [Prevotellaceae bacterium]
MDFSKIVSEVSSFVWGIPIIVFLMAAGFYFSFRTRFLQIRYFRRMIRMLLSGKSSKSGISSFQAFALALSGRVGTGNIAGVATAIALGGPGAVFWMWAFAFFGAATAYVEASLGQIYKEKIDGHYRGGPAFYILKGLNSKYFALFFAAITIISLGLLLPGIQSNAICDAFHNSFEIDKHVSAGFIVLLLALIIFGGVKRLARVAECITPFMAIGYVLVAGVILVMNWHHIPSMLLLILRSAFGIDSAVGGIVGSAIIMGVKRGVFSNEAGQGTAPHAAAACEVSHPSKQGLVQAFSIYVDTLLVCSATAFIILITGMYNIYSADGTVLFYGGGLPPSETGYGPVFTQLAVDVSISGFGSGFVAIALFFFAFTTIMSYYFQAETNVYFLFRSRRISVYMINILRVIILAVTFFTGINAMTLAWDMADIGVGIMAWLNLVALILLQKTALKIFFDFEKQLKSGIENPVFDPDKLGIKNTSEWDNRSGEKE